MTKSVWMNHKGDLMVAWNKELALFDGPIGWYFQTKFTVPGNRFTVLSPGQWGWTYLSEL